MAINTGSDSEFDSRVNSCMARVDLKKAVWVIPQTEIDLVTPFLTDWNTKYGVTKNKKLASAADREAKDLARTELSPVFSNFVEVNIYRNKNMNDADIKSCDLEPRKKTKTKAGKPKTVPQMEYEASHSHIILAYYHQEPGADGVSKRGKPKGVGRIEIAYVIIDTKPDPVPMPTPAPTPPAGKDNPLNWNPDDFPKTVSGTKSPVEIHFSAADAGKTVVLCARWISTTNIAGDWGKIEMMMVP